MGSDVRFSFFIDLNIATLVQDANESCHNPANCQRQPACGQSGLHSENALPGLCCSGVPRLLRVPGKSIRVDVLVQAGSHAIMEVIVAGNPYFRIDSGTWTMASSNQLEKMYHDLAVMLQAGIPILRTFDIAIENTTGGLQPVLKQISEALTQGTTLSEAMDMHARVFARFDRMLVKAADQSGNLDACCEMLSQWYQFRMRLKRIVVGGILLPFFIFHVAAFIFPLPNLILGESGFYGYLGGVFSVLSFLYTPLVFVLLVLYLGPRFPLLRRVLDHISLRIPVLGRGVRELCISRFAKAFGMLYKAGVPISECFSLAPQVTGNLVVSRFFSGGLNAVAQGKNAGEGFSREVPSEYAELWKIGEESGQLDKSVDKIAEISADRAELFLSEFSRWLPRIIYFFLAMRMVSMIVSLAQSIGQSYTIPL
jgi:type IV pilus assembly protein PilC